MIWTAQDIVTATGGKAFSQWHGGKIVFDSRLIEEGDIFIALPGQNSDGHNFVKTALDKKAAGAIVTKIPTDIETSEKLIIVKNCLNALEDMAKFKRSKSKAKFIAITGSVGKTSTKELVNLALEAHGKTFASRGNYNNFLGVPINLASIPDDAEYVIIEMGMDHKGEITQLSKLCRPHVAIITSIESIHIANFNSLEGIAEAKAEIFDGIEPNSLAIINALSNCYGYLQQITSTNPNISRVMSMGLDSKITSYEIQNNNTKSLLDIRENLINIHLAGIIGKHQIYNILTALTLCSHFGLDLVKSINTLEKFQLPRGRGKVSTINLNGNNITVLDDSYNAGPVSMKAALKTLSLYSGRKIAILGDMVDLGPNSEELHLSLKRDIINNNIDKVICFGKQMQALYKELPIEKQHGCYLTLETLKNDISNKLKNGDILLIKGSFYLTRLYYFTQHLIEGTLDAL